MKKGKTLEPGLLASDSDWHMPELHAGSWYSLH